MPVKRPKLKIPKDILTNETFVFEVYPKASPNAVFSFDAHRVALYKQHGKCYLVIKADLLEISAGTFNTALGAIAGLNDESAAEKLTDMYNAGRIKKIQTIETTRRYYRNGGTNQKRVAKKYGSCYK